MPVAIHAFIFDGDDEPPVAEFVTYGDTEAEAESRYDALVACCELLKAREDDVVLVSEELDETDLPHADDYESDEDDVIDIEPEEEGAEGTADGT